jgi:ATP-dependent RNA helicase SUPV3L1/SUV3
MTVYPVASDAASGPGRVLAVLGPTNTGKTHFAVERMLGHGDGVIGLPLRLLAREIYDRVVAQKGARSVALITGEEKIVPPAPRWFVCTVESMPLERDFDFLAVDEIQLCADGERGHAFTDRLLRARGRQETLFLGADTMRGLIRRLVPGVEYVARPRLSRLSYTGPKKLSRLPPRSAIVAFSAADVYALAEQVRRQRGGAAVVLGALSPRTRNAQVAMFQNGEVDYLVATDAIGMGLNLAIDHVAFASLTKFDGFAPRHLTAAEIGQIAGRAGRYMHSGGFGVTGDMEGLDADMVERVENHRFDAVTKARWRNAALDFSTPRDLLRSLDLPPPGDGLIKARDADDLMALKTLSADPAVAALARNRTNVRLLWEVCQIPDFRKSMGEAHWRLLQRIYGHLAGPAGKLPTDWVGGQMAQLDRADGDIDTLATRIAHVRTWTYVSYRADWFEDARHWQERARAIEDRLSDALHERLTQRFVDRRSAFLARQRKSGGDLSALVSADGEVTVEGETVGRIAGLAFTPAAHGGGELNRALRAAAQKAVAPTLAQRADDLARDNDAAFAFDDGGRVLWRGAPVARMTAGENVLSPRLETAASDLLRPGQRARVERRLRQWLDRQIAEGLRPLVRLRDAHLTGAARGLAFQLVEGLGLVPRRQSQAVLGALTPAGAARLKSLGVRLGAEALYVPALLGAKATRLKALLWAAHRDVAPPWDAAGNLGIDAHPDLHMACGRMIVGGHAIRIDRLERLAGTARRLATKGAFAASIELLRLVDGEAQALRGVLLALGYKRQENGETDHYFRPARPAGRARKPRRVDPRHADSPFAALKARLSG